MIGKSDSKKGADPTAARVEQDQKLLPRIESISGIGSAFTAEAEFDGDTTKTLRIGEYTLNGFMVEDIQSSFVMLRGGASKQLFQIMPKAPKKRWSWPFNDARRRH